MTNEELAKELAIIHICSKPLALAALDGDLTKVYEITKDEIETADEFDPPVLPSDVRHVAEVQRAIALVCSRLAAVTESIAIEMEKENECN